MKWIRDNRTAILATIAAAGAVVIVGKVADYWGEAYVFALQAVAAVVLLIVTLRYVSATHWLAASQAELLESTRATEERASIAQTVDGLQDMYFALGYLKRACGGIAEYSLGAICAELEHEATREMVDKVEAAISHVVKSAGRLKPAFQSGPRRAAAEALSATNQIRHLQIVVGHERARANRVAEEPSLDRVKFAWLAAARADMPRGAGEPSWESFLAGKTCQDAAKKCLKEASVLQGQINSLFT